MSSWSDTREDPSRVWIYHERQESLLCGQHALNNLLQTYYFSAEELAQVAQQLDSLELQYMADNNEGGVHSRDYQKRLNEGSSNVDERGNFSIQVLKTCLNRYFALQREQQQQQRQQQRQQNPPNGPTAAGAAAYGNDDDTEDWLPHLTASVLQDRLGVKDVTQVAAFLLHKSDHWLAIRQINGRFFNLNSTLERPVPISQFDLGTQLSQAASLTNATPPTTTKPSNGHGASTTTTASAAGSGYTVFCVAAPLPPPYVGDEPPSHGYTHGGGGTGTWYNMAELLKWGSSGMSTGAGGSMMNAYSSQPQQRQQAASNTSSMTKTGPASTPVDPWTKVTGTGRRLDGRSITTTSNTTASSAVPGGSNIIDSLTEDEQFQLAVQLSQQESEPAAPPQYAAAASSSSAESDEDLWSIVIPEEPSLSQGSAQNCCTLQFRLPQGVTRLRRFPKDMLVIVLYAYCAQELSITTHSLTLSSLELRAAGSFPPRNLEGQRRLTLEQAKISNYESIQVRIVPS